MPVVVPKTGTCAAEQVLIVAGLRKSYGGREVVAGIGFALARGECYGLLGPNGAGKTTILRCCLGLTLPEAGNIRLVGEAVPERARQARMKVGVVPQFDNLDPDFTVAENLLVFGRYFGFQDHETRRRIPDLLVLDEPTTGLDPQARHLIWERLKHLLSAGKTILLTTHFMDEAERLCHRLAILDQGRVVAEGTPRELIDAQIEPQVIEVYGEDAPGWAAAEGKDCAKRLELSGETAFCYLENEDVMPLMARLARHPGLRALHRPANLEDVFLKLTGRELRD